MWSMLKSFTFKIYRFKQKYPSKLQWCKDFICQYSSHYSCITCEKHVYDKEGGIFCDGCNLWSHGWCARVSKLEHKCLTEKSAET